MIKKLIKLANHLDSKGLAKEADYLDGIIKRAIDPTTKSINMPGAKDKVKVMFKGNETYDKISKIIAARNLPKQPISILKIGPKYCLKTGMEKKALSINF